jgi:2,3-dihydroxyphenylpropionate 1,2-dioxygenase
VSEVVVGVTASHTTLMNTHWHLVEGDEDAERFKGALTEAHDTILDARPDLVVIVGSNHFRGFWLDLMPSFTIGVGDVIASGENGTPSGPQPTDPEAARSICAALSDADIDIAFSTRLQVDHGVTHAVQYLLAGIEAPIVPIVVNVFAPPLPKLSRCRTFADALHAAIRGLPGDRRIAVIGSGGLSHHLPWPDWQHPETDDDAFMVEAWTDGRANWSAYEQRRRQIVLSGTSRISSDFDRSVLAMVEAGSMRDLVDHEHRLTEWAGNGGNEIRTWLIAAGACGWHPGRVLTYSPVAAWLTGMAVAVYGGTA